MTPVLQFPLAISLVLGIFYSAITVSLAQQREVRADLAVVFDQHGTNGTFVVFDQDLNTLTLVNAARAAIRMFPASTFKIVNSLIALETGVVADENTVIPFGNKPQPVTAWERDMSMREAIKISNVPVFQELARRIGIASYEKWLKRLGYGNQRVGNDVETFWLQGPLKISAIEQVLFLSKLARKTLPSSKRSQTVVADITTLVKRGDTILYGKTGWTIAATPEIGWFVGWIENRRGSYAFALNMDIASNSDAKKRMRIARILLNRLDIF